MQHDYRATYTIQVTLHGLPRPFAAPWDALTRTTGLDARLKALQACSEFLPRALVSFLAPLRAVRQADLSLPERGSAGVWWSLAHELLSEDAEADRSFFPELARRRGKLKTAGERLAHWGNAMRHDHSDVSDRDVLNELARTGEVAALHVLENLSSLAEYRLIGAQRAELADDGLELEGAVDWWRGAMRPQHLMWRRPTEFTTARQKLYLAHHDLGLLPLHPFLQAESGDRSGIAILHRVRGAALELKAFGATTASNRVDDVHDTLAATSPWTYRRHGALPGVLGQTPAPTDHPWFPRGYRPVRLIGSGGMAEVFEVEDQNGAKFAIKILKRDASDEHRARLDREGQILEELHLREASRVVKAHRHTTVDGRPAVRMPLYDTDLGRRASEPHAASDVMPWALEILRALEEIHAQDVVHRDVKPSNFLVRRGAIHLADFGAATRIADARLTQVGASAPFTPLYAAPESVHGVQSPRSDVFSAGLTIVELLVGRDEFDPQSALEKFEVRSRGSAEGEFLPVLRQMLEQDPVRRPTSAQARAWIARLFAGGPATATNVPRTTARPDASIRRAFEARLPASTKAPETIVYALAEDDGPLGWFARGAAGAVMLQLLSERPPSTLVPSATTERPSPWSALRSKYIASHWAHVAEQIPLGELLSCSEGRLTWSETRLRHRAWRTGGDFDPLHWSHPHHPGMPVDVLADCIGAARAAPLDEFRFLKSFYACEDAHNLHHAWNDLFGQLPEPRYRSWVAKKATGGVRQIHAPKGLLKAVQRALAKELVASVPGPALATGFLPGRSTALHARMHQGAQAAVVVDIVDFFGSVYPRHLEALFKGRKLPKISQEWIPPLKGWSLRGRRALQELCFSRHRGWACLPQGAPTSPILSNIAAYAMDQEIIEALDKAFPGRTLYSRYADDLVVSFHPLSPGLPTASGSSDSSIEEFWRRAEEILLEKLSSQGWRTNSAKRRRWRAPAARGLHRSEQDGRRLFLCGVGVPMGDETSLRLPRRTRRRIRVAMRDLEKAADDRKPVSNRTTGLLAYASSITASPAFWMAASPTAQATARDLARCAGANDHDASMALRGWIWGGEYLVRRFGTPGPNWLYSQPFSFDSDDIPF